MLYLWPTASGAPRGSWLVVLCCYQSQLVTAIDWTRTPIDRHATVSQHNPVRTNTSSAAYDTPAFLGNGRLGFSADITGLQSLLPFNTLSSWGWHNDSLPTTPNQTSPATFRGVDLEVHGRLVEYDQPNPDLPEISQWMIANPNRINLGRIGLRWHGEWLTDTALASGARQELNLWTGVLESSFQVAGEPVVVWTAVHPQSDTVAVKIRSRLLCDGQLAVSFDFPYASGQNKFDAPFVGVWNATNKHSTTAEVKDKYASIKHVLDATTYMNDIRWQQSDATLDGPEEGTHRYTLAARKSTTLTFTSTFSPAHLDSDLAVDQVFADTSAWWEEYWQTGAFIGFPAHSERELERRIILSQYLTAANTANCDYSEQESGLVNNGWYGKFHLEMTIWHNLHYVLWRKPQYLSSMMPGMYQKFLPSSLARAEQMGYNGARWGKMSDPSGRSAPGTINSLLIWQQPHPMFFADQEYQLASAHGKPDVLDRWADIIRPTADFMASFAWWNRTTSRYDLGPPMYPSSENTDPLVTVNPAFELAYWQYGLQVAIDWNHRLGAAVPDKWIDVRDKLAPLPTDYVNGSKTYVIYEGISDMWNNATYSK